MTYIKETSKEEIFEAIRIFGLKVDLDNWDASPNGNTQQFIRVNTSRFNVEPLIIYREDFQMKSLEDAMPHDIEDVYYLLRNYLMMMGQHTIQIKMKQLLNIS